MVKISNRVVQNFKVMRFKDLDIFPKMREDYARQTSVSGTITLICVSIMAYLFISQTASYLLAPMKQSLKLLPKRLPTDEDGFVDFEKLDRVHINFDIMLHNLPCQFVDFGIIDSYKEVNNEAFSKVKLHRYLNGKRIKNSTQAETPMEGCGSCFGQLSGCCNTCKDVKRAFRAKGRVPPPLHTIPQCKQHIASIEAASKESCHVHGTAIVPFFAGTIFISPGDSYGARSDIVSEYSTLNMTLDDFNMTHTFNSLSVGADGKEIATVKGLKKLQGEKGRYKSLYFLRTVLEETKSGIEYPTTVTNYDRYRTESSVKFPGIYIHYDIAPIIVKYIRDKTFLRFLVQLMAILGGVFSVGNVIDHITAGSARKRTPKAFMN